MSSLYEKIGGKEAVNEAVDIFYEKVLENTDLSHFFYYTDMAAQYEKQKLFLTMVFGGPVDYTGENLRAIHAPLVAKGLNEKHFDLVFGFLKSTLEEIKVPQDVVDEAMSLVNKTKNDILNR